MVRKTVDSPFSSGSRIRQSGARAAAAAAALVLCAAGAGLRADSLYFTAVSEYPHFLIRKSDLDGTNIKEVVTGMDDDLGGIAIDSEGGFMYWVENGTTNHQIARARLDGSGRMTVLPTQGFLQRIALDAPRGMIYFTESMKIRRTDRDGTAVELVFDGEAVDLAIDSEGQRIYWVEEGELGTYGTDIWRAALDGTGKEPVVHHPFEHHTTGIALDAARGKLYWGTIDYRTDHTQVISRANLDGTGVEPLTRANPGLDDWPTFMALDLRNQWVYWVNGEDGVFYRVAFEGGEAEELGEDPGAFGPFGLALAELREPAPAAFRRGDADGDGSVDVSDPVFTLGALFLGTGAPPCEDAADSNDDGAVDIADAVASLSYQFLGAFVIPAPGPVSCGADPTPEALTCGSYPACPR